MCDILAYDAVYSLVPGYQRFSGSFADMTLHMEAACYVETFVFFYQSIHCKNAKECNLITSLTPQVVRHLKSY
jgi:hypothetical protein